MLVSSCLMWFGWLLGNIILNINCSIKRVSLLAAFFVDDGLNLVSAVL